MFIIYSLIFLALIYYNGFFGLFMDDRITKKQFSLLFFFKLLAVPVFYLVFQRLYGGIEKFDAGIFYRDAKAVNAFAKTDFLDYLKMLFGLQDDSKGSYVYDHCLIYTTNWDNGRIKDFLYNDNRIVIRIYSLLYFIAFKSYFAQALFSCFLSFIGIMYLYKAIKDFFVGKEIVVLLILCFFPALWFYTGALLKEGITILFLGCLIYQLKQVIYGRHNLKAYLGLIVLIFISLLLKPYLLFFSGICFMLFFVIYHSSKVRYKLFVFFSILFLSVMSINSFSIAFKNKSLSGAALARQRVFADAAKGGIFLLDSLKFVRLEFDSSLVNRLKDKNNYFTIKKNVPYIYWEHTHQQDTLFCAANQDTLTQYSEVYRIKESGSNFELKEYSKSLPGLVLTCLHYSLAYPLFFNAKSPLLLLASTENVLLLLSILIVLISLLRNKKNPFPPVVFMFLALAVCFLIGLTTPNSGAIFRYRSPTVIFILLAALYYLPVKRKSLEEKS